MFCKYCGKEIKENGVCDCEKAVEARRQEAASASPQTSKPVPQPPAPKAPQKKTASPNQGKGSGAVFVSIGCLLFSLVSFLCMRFLLADTFAAEEAYSYLMYIVPAVLGVAACIAAIFSINERSRTTALVLIVLSVLDVAVIVGSMIVFPYEDEYVSRREDDKEERRNSRRSERKDAEDEAEKGAKSLLEELEKDYRDEKIDYAEAVNGLAELGDDLSDSEERKMESLKKRLRAGLESEMKDFVKNSEYKEALEKLNQLNGDLEEEDELVEELLDKYETEYIEYLVEESESLMADEAYDDAIDLLSDAREVVRNTKKIDRLLDDVEDEKKDAEEKIAEEAREEAQAKARQNERKRASSQTSGYILPDSNSRYLTNADIAGLSLREINYAKNEIYARRGRKFDSVELQQYFGSKSWYRGVIEPGAFTNGMLNDYEIANAEFLSSIEFGMQEGGYQLR